MTTVKSLIRMALMLAIVGAALTSEFASAEPWRGDDRGGWDRGRGGDWGRGGGWDRGRDDRGRGPGRPPGRPPGPPPPPQRPGYAIDPYLASQFVDELYRAILMRSADASGLRYYSDRVSREGFSALQRSAYEIATSPEYRQNIERRTRPDYIIQNVYRVLLGREADPGGLQSWSQMVYQGRSGEAMSGIVGSDEYRRRHGL